MFERFLLCDYYFYGTLRILKINLEFQKLLDKLVETILYIKRILNLFLK